jgi:lysophospholipase L1-like esterase
VALALLSLVVGLGALEGGSRLWAWRENRRGFDRAMALARPPAPGATVTLGGLIRPSPDSRIVYELWPGMDVFFDGSDHGRRTRVRTGRAGFRDRDYPVEKSRSIRRIVGIGDSLMFGWGVEQGQDYLSVLEEKLNAGSGAGVWEVLNTAVPGYNTAMEVETLETKGLAYRPDLVVLGFCANDASLPNFILPEKDVLSLRESFLVGFVRGRLGPPPAGDALVLAPRRGDDRAFEDDPSRVPPRYREIAGWGAFARALRRLVELGRTHGFRTLVVAFSPEHTDERKERGLRQALELGLPVLDFGRVEGAYMRARGIDRYAGSVLTVSAEDAHPSPLSHELAATELFGWMAGEGLVPHRRPPAVP